LTPSPIVEKQTAIAVREEKLSKAREVKQGMMSVLLMGRGEVGVNDMDTEVTALEGTLSTVRMMSVLLSGKVRLV